MEVVAAPLANAAVEKVANDAVDLVWRQIGYIWNYKSNIQDLEHQLQKLKAERQSMQHCMDEARKNVEEIEDTANIWLKSADDAIKAAEELLQSHDTSRKSCFVTCCPNFITRHQFSRKAKKETPVVAQVQQERNSIQKISRRLNVQAVEPVKSYEALESRLEVLKAVAAALKNGDTNLIGVYGLGGVGKTTLATKQVIAQVREEGIFKVVAIANVTLTWDLSRIQQEIADWLELKLDIKSTEVRAARLRARLKQEEKVLIVLDDIWEKIELEKIGIPNSDDHKGCKILMTSRDLNILLNMGVQKHFLVQVLSEVEQWQLFKKMFGDFKNSELESIAIEVARRCAGLPVLVLAVATSLRDKKLYEWKDALVQLQKFDGKGMEAQVYSGLELSYKFLSEDQKSLLVLCAQAGGSTICSTILKYATGLGLFNKCTPRKALRNRLLTVVNDLKRSCLLMEGENHEIIRIHDVVLNFATRIATKQHHVFTVASQTELKEWPKKGTLKLCTAISLPHCKIPALPQLLECPKLESFIFYNDDPSLKIPDKFFNRSKKLKLIDLTDVNLSPNLPSSLGSLQSLQTLCLDGCVLEDTSAIGQLHTLQVLSLRGSDIIQLPTEIRNLTSLLELDLSGCRRLEVIPPGILICLTKLEELGMLGTFVRWDGEGHTSQRNNASLSELKTLSNLNHLQIHIIDAKIMPVGLFHRRLEMFRILIGDNWDYDGDYEISKMLKLKLNAGFELERVKVLLIDAECLYLSDLKGVENVVPKLERHGFPNLKRLQIQNCQEVKYIIDRTETDEVITFPCLESLSLLNLNKLENICYRPFISNCFSNLNKLKVGNCNALKNLFSFDTFRYLVQLQEIDVSECHILKEVVSVGYEDETIKLTQLHTLTLDGLPQLEGFCSPTDKASAETDESENLFSTKIQFPNLVELNMSSINVEKIWDSIEFCPFEKLTTLIVQGCGNFACALTSSMVRSLAQLKIFEISGCKLMEEVIRTEGETEEMIFPKLNYLKLKGLPKVVKFCRANLIQCPSMEVLWIDDCPRLQTFVSTSDADSSTLFDEKVDFPNLDRLIISRVNRLTEIWGNELSEESFRKLKQLTVEYAEEVMKVFPHNMDLRRFQSLEELYILDCNALTNVFDIQDPIDVQIQRGGAAVSQLKTLWIINTPNLKHVWNEDPKAVLEFQNLSNVDIRGCQSLKSVFPAPVARGLMRLQKFDVCDSSIKEIVAQDKERIQGEAVFEFRRLEELTLRRLPQLETFYPGTHTSEWPALKALFITECDQFHLPTLFHEMVQIIPELEELSLNDKWIRMIREGELPVELFYKLKLVEFNFFDEKSAVFPYDLLRMFHNLETLQISASRFKELFPPEEVFVGDEKHPLILTKLHSLELYNLSDLETIWNQVLQTLKCLIIQCCDNLIILAPSSACFPSLTSLDIGECRGLVSLVTSSTAKSLIQLKKLKVSKCERVKVIVSDEGDEIKKEINFIKLEILELDGLPSLTSFCAGKHSFKFPSLTKVVVNQCPKMELFSKGVASTSMLAGVQSTEDENREDWLGNLNSTMHFLYEKMVGFCGVQHLKVSEFSNLRDRWHDKLPVDFFRDLESLEIDEVAFSSYAIPSNLLEYLNKLEHLRVNNCEVLEYISDVRRLSAIRGHVGLLCRLNTFNLISLPRLRNIWNEHTQGILNFKHLTSLKVHHCSSLKTIFTPSMAQGLVQLQEMEVKYCNSVKEIITRGAANEVTKEIIFPLLQSIILESLPCIISFNSGREILKCPSLEEIAIVDCPTTFTCTFLRDLQSHPADGTSEPKVVFPNLKGLKLSSVKIQKIWYNKQQLGVSAFTENLTSLNIDGCGNLKRLFSTSMVKGLIQLKSLEVCNCKLMEEIIHMENNGKIGEIVFRKLELVKLRNLQQLAQFCTANFIECVGLTTLWIEECPELGAFISESAISNNLNGTCYPEIVNSTLFDKKVDFPNLDTLIISGVNGLKEIWDSEFREDSFCKLKRLTVQDAKAVVKVFPTNLDLRRFQNLEELWIEDCDALTEVFDVRALIYLNIERGCVIATQLQKLRIYGNQKLEHVWNEDPKGVLDFHNLNTVDIRVCPSLKSVFPGSIARGLMHLESLCVVDSAIKEIIARDEERIRGASMFQFPQMKDLLLRRLPQLQTFYPGTHTSEWPALKQLHITESPQFQHSTLSFKKIIPNLEELALNGKEVQMIRDGKLPVELFHKLKVVEFNFFNEKSTAFPHDLLHIFHNLETLKVPTSKFKELFPTGGIFLSDEKHPLILKRMHTLELFRLPNLKTVWNQVLQTLQTLSVLQCDSLTILAPSSASFQSLTSLEMYNCKGLVSLVTLSSATSLMRLQNLTVRNCNQVKVIVSDEGNETMDEINFVKLETLVLDCLPNFTSFCLGNHSFKFPSLTKVVVKQCPEMELFSKGVSVTPMLNGVQLIEDENGGDWLGNLNMTISFLYKKTVGLRGLQYLKLSKFSNLKDRWHNELPREFFYSLKSLVIDEVEFTSCAIPSSLLEYLKNLGKLEVTNCELLEEVFDRQGLSDEAEGQTAVLSILNSFHLINLPRLSQVWNEHPRQILNFERLKSLKVHNCCSLRMIFTPSMTQRLGQLQEIEVKNCHSVEEIISKGAEEDDRISFPQLNSLVLDSLPKLTVLRTGRGIVHCPSMEKITVMDCPNVDVLTWSADEDQEPIKSDGNSIFFGKVTCGSLKELRVDWSNNIKKIADGESAATHDFFSSLKVLELKHIPTEYSIFPFRFLERSPNLEELIVRDASFEELFSQEGTVNEEESTHLRRLTLSTLPLLRHLIKDCIELGCSFIQHLEALEVLECNKITILVPSFISYRNLTTLKVSKCHGLLNLVTSSTARSMTQLTRLEIMECKMVEEIVAGEGDHEVEAEIGFSQLKHLQLHCLPRLTRFGSGNETFNFPSLEEVIVRECPKMEIFVQGELSTPNLESVQTTEDENEWCWDGSLNATIQKLFEETVAEKVEEH